MRFSLLVTVFAAAVVTALPEALPRPQTPGTVHPNAFTNVIQGMVFTAGTKSTLNWTPSAGKTVTIVLRSGASSDLGVAGTAVAEKIPNSGSYDWTPSTSITRGSDYVLQIIDDDAPTAYNYAGPFVIDSSNTVASSTGAYTYGYAGAISITMSTAGGASSATSLAMSTTSTTSQASSVTSAVANSASSGASSASSKASTAILSTSAGSTGTKTTTAAASATTSAMTVSSNAAEKNFPGALAAAIALGAAIML